MNAILYFKLFAWLALATLALALTENFWLPLLLGAAGMVVFLRSIRR